MAGLVLTRPRASGGGTATANAFESVVADSGSVTAVGADTLVVKGGTAIITTAIGSPKSVEIAINPSEINLNDLGDVIASSPIDGEVLTYRAGSPTGWVPEFPPTAPGGLQRSTINGQQIMTFLDTTRGTGSPPVGKRLSIAEQTLVFAENVLTINDWIRIGNANDADTGFIMDLDGTITFATGHCENAQSNGKNIHLFVNGVDHGSIGTLSGAGEVQFVNTTLDVDFSQGDKIRLQAQQGTGTAILDTVIKLVVRWRT